MCVHTYNIYIYRYDDADDGDYDGDDDHDHEDEDETVLGPSAARRSCGGVWCLGSSKTSSFPSSNTGA